MQVASGGECLSVLPGQLPRGLRDEVPAAGRHLERGRYGAKVKMVPFILSLVRPDVCADVVEQKVQICIYVLPQCPRRLTGKEKRVGGFDLMWNGGPVHRDDLIPASCGSPSFPSNTHLGNQMPQEQHLPIVLFLLTAVNHLRRRMCERQRDAAPPASESIFSQKRT